MKADCWRSLDELEGNAEFRRLVENEFPASAGAPLSPGSRREFLKLMAASLGLAGMAGCRWPREEILPFADQPDGATPGELQRFATTIELAGGALGLLVASHDGRPIKIEGNPLHPASRGGTSAIAQASLLELYDPDRSRSVVRGRSGARSAGTWEGFSDFWRDRFEPARAAGGAGLRVLAEASSSPSMEALRERFLRVFPAARWVEYEPLSRDNEREGTRLAFGRALRPHLALGQADVVVAFDEDFLFQHPAAVAYARDFAERRSPGGTGIGRLYVVEGAYSLTGTMADHRRALPAQMIPVAAGCLAANLLLEHGLELPPGCAELRRMIERFQAHPAYTEVDGAAARDLMAHRGRSLIVAGPRQPAAIHALVHLLNHALGGGGGAISFTEDPDGVRRSHPRALADLAREIDAGEVATLVVLGGNPAYDAPSDLGFGSLFERVEQTVHLSLHENETSRLCTWHLPRAHFLEAWGDARDWRGTRSVVQPLIEPLFGGRTPIEVVALMLGEPRTGHAIVRETFARLAGAEPAEPAWRRALHDGLCAGSEWPTLEAQPQAADWADQLAPLLRTHARFEGAAVEVVFVPGAGVYDGRFANNAWLQELPDPLTKLTWDNAALVAPETARRLGLEQGRMVRLSRGRQSLELPVYIMPGQAAGSIAVALGYGRRAAGRVGDGVGFDGYALRTSDALDWANVELTPLSGRHALSTTQNHYAIDPLGQHESAERSRTLVRELDHDAYVERLQRGHEPHVSHEAPLWKPREYDGHKWGMAIDLNACVGCNACVVACQAENNIPVVGKDEVGRGREMHWIRVDRYFSGDPASPAVAHQPLTCHHCETAPCEQVCPVAATVHDHEGLNLMVYNRCVGTRYCANNCPYKVRRFNYFNNHREQGALERMVYNPDVTVRSRGVMEKCTFCIQRIQRVKIDAGNERRGIRDGEIVPACAQACPTRAIAFGDLNDPDSRVRRLHDDPRAYSLLDGLDLRPRTRYLSRLRNRSAGDASGPGA